MNRRGFLSSLIATGLSAAVDPERLLWTPGKRLISIPKPQNNIYIYRLGNGLSWIFDNNMRLLTNKEAIALFKKHGIQRDQREWTYDIERAKFHRLHSAVDAAKDLEIY